MQEELFAFIDQYMPLTAEERHALVQLDIFHSFPKGTVLVRAGERSQRSYFVLKGCLRSYRVVDGEERTVELCTENEGLTPPWAADKATDELYVMCLEDVILVVANEGMEQEMFERFPRFQTLCRIVSEKQLVENKQAFADFKDRTPEERYVHLQENRPDLIQRVPQQHLASYLGITPESLSRIRKRIARPANGVS
ncbi:MAG: Crp/Fnr family transcriptional regulator [Flavobacteriales bacterium]|nr:Crp/Fnr family transcriptional regulator [Flavobacteriales bacterium]